MGSSSRFEAHTVNNGEAEVSSEMAIGSTSSEMAIRTTYPGGKNNVYQKLINLIPPHKIYIETHLGSGAIARNKRPADHSYLIDLDPDVTQAFSCSIVKDGDNSGVCSIVTSDAVAWLKGYQFTGDEFIYCDPPYVMATRRQQRPIYRYEYTDAQHRELLTVVTKIACPVMISGYWSELYQEYLRDWNIISFEAVTRGGTMATEFVWMNYPEPVELHDYRYLGDNFRERERIKRKKARWVKKFSQLPVLERQVIMMALQESPLAKSDDRDR